MDFTAIDPIAFQLGPFVVRWYALAYLAGFLLGWRYAIYLSHKDADNRPHKDDIDDFFMWAILGVILGGRIGYILFYNLPYYLEYPQEMLMIWHGGMSFHGGLLGTLIAMLGYSKFKHVSFLRLSDIVCCVVPIGLFFGRIANFINGELYGRITQGPWGIVFPHAGEQARHPSQLYEAGLEGALLFIILFVLVKFIRLDKFPGGLTGVFLMGYGMARFVVEFVREPDEHIGLIGDLVSMGQILSLPMIMMGFCLILLSFFFKTNK